MTLVFRAITWSERGSSEIRWSDFCSNLSQSCWSELEQWLPPDQTPDRLSLSSTSLQGSGGGPGWGGLMYVRDRSSKRQYPQRQSQRMTLLYYWTVLFCLFVFCQKTWCYQLPELWDKLFRRHVPSAPCWKWPFSSGYLVTEGVALVSAWLCCRWISTFQPALCFEHD